MRGRIRKTRQTNSSNFLAGYKGIPNCPNYVMNMNGDVRNIKTRKLVKPYHDKGVSHVCVRDSHDRWVTFSRISLIGKLFVIADGCPTDQIRMFAPKNGDFDDIRPENIVPIYKYYIPPEKIRANTWYTIPEFSRYKIRPDGKVKDATGVVLKPTIVAEINGREIFEYLTPNFIIDDCNNFGYLRSFGLTKDYLLAITFQEHSGYHHEYCVYLGEDKISHVQMSKHDLIRIDGFKNIQATNILDANNVIFFNSESHAAKYFKVSRRTILRKISGHKPILLNHRYDEGIKNFLLTEVV